jgi:hypothetical protein
VAAAQAILGRVVGPEAVSASAAAEGWIAVRTDVARASELNRALAEGGIYASGLESGSDLESLFLGLTGGEPAPGGEGAFQRIAT